MGKSNKKKRRRERKRLRQIQASSNQLNMGTPSSVAATCGSSASLTTPPSSSSSVSIRQHDTPGTQRNEEGNASFGSVASRKRKLVEISFVFPKQNGQRLPFHFRSKEENRGSVKSQQLKNEKLSSSDSPSKKRKISQSIDDILYQKTEVTKELKSPPPNGDNSSSTNVRAEREASGEPRDKTPLNKDSPAISEVARPQSPRLEPHKPHYDDRPTSPRTSTHAQSAHLLRGNYLSGVSVEEAVRDKVGLRPRSNSTDGELNLPQRGLCDERQVLENYKWRRNVSKGPPRGLNNLGNSCYLNSTLQCLAYCPPFCQSLLTMSLQHQKESTQYSSSITQPNNGKNRSQGKKITHILAGLFRQIHSTENGNHNGNSKALSPRNIVSAVPSLGSCGSHRNGYKFRPGRQEDAHEFLVHLLDAMNDGELCEAGIDVNKSGWRDRLPVPRLDETTFVHRIFGGYLRSQVRCTVCGYRSNTYDPFLDLSLEISRKSCYSIATALQEFTKKETLDSENRWKCSGCKKRVCATKKLTVFRPPLSLCIQLKRFSYGGSFGGFVSGFGGFGGFGRGGKKISKPVNFPAHLELPLSDKRSCGYSLTGIVIHVGGSASSGHYTACIKKTDQRGKDRWFHVDDSFVQAVSEQEVLRQRDAYMLLYCRKEVKLEFPSPPLRGSMTAKEAQEFGRVRARARADSVTESIDGALGKDRVTVEQKDSSVDVQAKQSDDFRENPSNRKPAASAHESSISKRSKDAFIGPLPAPSPHLNCIHDESVKHKSPLDSKANTDIFKTPPQKTARRCESPIPDINTSPPSSTSPESEKHTFSKVKEQQEDKYPTPDIDSDSKVDVVDSRLSTVVVKQGSAPETESSEDDSSPDGGIEMRDTQKPKPSSSATSASPSDDKSSSSTESSQSSSSSSEESSETESTSSSTTTEHSSGAVGVPFAKTTGDDSSYEPTPKKRACQRNEKSRITRITMDRGSGGKVEVMLGPRHKVKKSWKPKTVIGSKDQGFELLGNQRVSKWEEDQEGSETRSKLVQQIDQNEKGIKRKMYLDRHDALIDQGRTKKVKKKKNVEQSPAVQTTKNQFQRIQASVQRMGRGRAKGFHNNNSNSGRRRR